MSASVGKFSEGEMEAMSGDAGAGLLTIFTRGNLGVLQHTFT